MKIKEMITCELVGGLGNQLFQIFATLAYAIQYNTSVMFEYSSHTSPYQTADSVELRHTYWNTFFVHIINLTTYSLAANSTIDLSSFFPYLEPRFQYDPLPREIAERNMKLSGYFQSYKYFHQQEQYIFKLLKIEKLQNMVKKIYEFPFPLNECTSLHFRIGDYQYHPQRHSILTLEYYKKALTCLFQKRTEQNVLCFCQEEDDALVNMQINVLKETFPEATFVKIGYEISDWEQLLIMSCCRDNIIANSTFSWWGAYLNRRDKNDAFIFYPSKWFGDDYNNKTTDLFPPHWLRINA
jgi:hypothetical protein